MSENSYADEQQITVATRLVILIDLIGKLGELQKRTMTGLHLEVPVVVENDPCPTPRNGVQALIERVREVEQLLLEEIIRAQEIENVVCLLGINSLPVYCKEGK